MIPGRFLVTEADRTDSVSFLTSSSYTSLESPPPPPHAPPPPLVPVAVGCAPVIFLGG